MFRNRFLFGVTLIALSSAGGWIALFAGGALAARYGPAAAKIGFWIYVVSWIPFGVGFLLSGKEGVRYSKEMFARMFRRRPPGHG